MWTCGPPTIDSGIRSRSIEEQGAPSVKRERLLSANSNEWRDRRWASWTEGPAPQSVKADPRPTRGMGSSLLAAPRGSRRPVGSN